MSRLDKYLAQHTGLSRRQVHQQVRRGEVSINAELIKKADYKLKAGDKVFFQGRHITPRPPVYLMLHKPAGVISATQDAHQPTVLDLLSRTELELPAEHPLQVAGRLDLDTTGLLLITDDGAWNHRLTAPAAGKAKRYRVQTETPIDPDYIAQFMQGLWLHGEKRPTRPARLTLLGPNEAWLELDEGRYHQVKRMFAAVGNRVVGLHREAVGAIELDPALSPGQYRPLTAEEIASV